MAKTTAPLLSLDSRGTIGKTVTYSYWKGTNYARLRVIPSNPRSVSQGDVRIKLGVAGKIVRQIGLGGTLQTQILAVAPANQSWASFFIREILGFGMVNIDAALTAYDNASVSKQGKFDTEAAGIPLSSFGVSYSAIESISGGEQLFIAAYAAFALGLAIAPVSPDSMDDAQIEAFASAFSAA